MAGGLSQSLFMWPHSWSEAALTASLTWSSDCSSPRGDLPSPYRTPTSNTPCGCWTSRWAHQHPPLACPATPKRSSCVHWPLRCRISRRPSETLFVFPVSDRQSRHQKVPLCSPVPRTRPGPPHRLVPALRTWVYLHPGGHATACLSLGMMAYSCSIYSVLSPIFFYSGANI